MQVVAESYVARARYFEREHFVDLLVLMGTTSKENDWQPSQVRWGGGREGKCSHVSDDGFVLPAGSQRQVCGVGGGKR